MEPLSIQVSIRKSIRISFLFITLGLLATFMTWLMITDDVYDPIYLVTLMGLVAVLCFGFTAYFLIKVLTSEAYILADNEALTIFPNTKRSISIPWTNIAEILVTVIWNQETILITRKDVEANLLNSYTINAGLTTYKTTELLEMLNKRLEFYK